MSGNASGIKSTQLFNIDNKSIYIPSADLYLDTRRKKKQGFISHAHSDHSAKHENVFCTPITSEFLRIRFKNIKYTTIDFGEEYGLNEARITFHPAGHILGSAQILIETDEGSLLYTGDFRTVPGRAVEQFKQLKCDVLIMETTFGNPKYRFPPRETVEDMLIQTVKEKLLLGITPVIFAYPLGKAQGALQLLSNNGIPVAADYSIIRYANLYKKYGIDFGPFEKFRRSDFRDRAILLPANFRYQRFVINMKPKFTVFLSGWGMNPSARFRFKVDQVLPFSDHADYDELIRFAQLSEANEIYCTHGTNDFVSILKNMGLNARPLIPSPQIELF